jgi:hypothetical protein
MKTSLIFLVFLIACVSCGTSNKPVSDAQKEKIKGEVKVVATKFIKACEALNFELAIEPLYDSPDFIYVSNGRTFSYQEVLAMNHVFDAILDQQITVGDEKYAFPDRSTVIYTTTVKSLVNYKDGHSILADPEVLQFTFKKIDGRWRVINYVDTTVEQTVKYKDPSKEINQVELMKQWTGTWKCDIAQDTTFFGEAKPYGTGMEWNFKYVTKGKTVTEAKLLWGYDRKVDKFIIAQIAKGMDMELWAVWFTADNKYIMLPYSDISNSEDASFKWEGEFKSPDELVETTIVNGTPVRTDTYVRVK